MVGSNKDTCSYFAFANRKKQQQQQYISAEKDNKESLDLGFPHIYLCLPSRKGFRQREVLNSLKKL